MTRKLNAASRTIPTDEKAVPLWKGKGTTRTVKSTAVPSTDACPSVDQTNFEPPAQHKYMRHKESARGS